MAYYAPFYRPSYYDQMQNPNMGQFNQQYQPQIQQMQPTQMSVANQQTNNGLVWVQGEAGAKSFLVAPGTTIMLMDSEGERFYLKSADASGMPLPLRTFEYKELAETSQQPANTPAPISEDMNTKYITREEFEQRMTAMASQCRCHQTKLMEETSDGE